MRKMYTILIVCAEDEAGFGEKVLWSYPLSQPRQSAYCVIWRNFTPSQGNQEFL